MSQYVFDHTFSTCPMLQRPAPVLPLWAKIALIDTATRVRAAGQTRQKLGGYVRPRRRSEREVFRDNESETNSLVSKLPGGDDIRDAYLTVTVILYFMTLRLELIYEVRSCHPFIERLGLGQ